jgi:hypothetical protein
MVFRFMTFKMVSMDKTNFSVYLPVRLLRAVDEFAKKTQEANPAARCSRNRAICYLVERGLGDDGKRRG